MLTCGGIRAVIILRASASAASVVTARSKERMVLQVSVDEIPKWIGRSVELVDGSHLGSLIVGGKYDLI